VASGGTGEVREDFGVCIIGGGHLQKWHLSALLRDCTSPQLLLLLEEAVMNDLYTWLSQQHHGLRTFRTFQQKLDDVSKDDPEQRALCRLLNVIVGSYVDTFDEEPLPVAVADRAHRRLLDLMASLDFNASADRRLADINRVAACDLWH
jgi:hypothetical protein